jgi:hypothetical protein
MIKYNTNINDDNNLNMKGVPGKFCKDLSELLSARIVVVGFW